MSVCAAGSLVKGTLLREEGVAVDSEEGLLALPSADSQHDAETYVFTPESLPI